MRRLWRRLLVLGALGALGVLAGCSHLPSPTPPSALVAVSSECERLLPSPAVGEVLGGNWSGRFGGSTQHPFSCTGDYRREDSAGGLRFVFLRGGEETRENYNRVFYYRNRSLDSAADEVGERSHRGEMAPGRGHRLVFLQGGAQVGLGCIEGRSCNFDSLVALARRLSASLPMGPPSPLSPLVLDWRDFPDNFLERLRVPVNLSEALASDLGPREAEWGLREAMRAVYYLSPNEIEANTSVPLEVSHYVARYGSPEGARGKFQSTRSRLLAIPNTALLNVPPLGDGAAGVSTPGAGTRTAALLFHRGPYFEMVTLFGLAELNAGLLDHYGRIAAARLPLNSS